MHTEDLPGFRHAGAGRHPDPSSTWIPFFNGMTDSVRHLDSACAGMTNRGGEQLLELPTIFMLCGRAQAHGQFVVRKSFVKHRIDDD
jgi:hypothetical protein